MNVATLHDLEAAGNYSQINALLANATKQGGNPQLWKYASSYFVRQGMAGKSLEYYSLYLNSTAASDRDIEAVSLAIECAHRLERHALVREYFLALSVAERSQLSDKTLTQVCRALLQSGLTDEAERVVKFLRQRHEAPQLPDFDAIIAERFGSKKAVLDFIARTPETIAAAGTHENIRHAMDLALAHMAQGNYIKAEKILVSCKTRIAA